MAMGSTDFFGTRSLAKEAIEAGKGTYERWLKSKVNKELQVGDTPPFAEGHATRLGRKNNHHQSPI